MHLQTLVDKIAELECLEHEEIAKLIAASDVPFTTNCNGVFVDVNAIPQETITLIDAFVSFCIENKKMLTDDQRFQPYQNSMTPETNAKTVNDVDTVSTVEEAKTYLRDYNIYNILFPDKVVAMRKKQQVKKTFVQNTRRTDFYNAECNELEMDWA